MFVGKILTGGWEEETIILKGMPKDFVLSARDLAVLEIDEYEQLKTALEVISDHEDRRKKAGVGYDSMVDNYAKQALKENEK